MVRVCLAGLPEGDGRNTDRAATCRAICLVHHYDPVEAVLSTCSTLLSGQYQKRPGHRIFALFPLCRKGWHYFSPLPRFYDTRSCLHRTSMSEYFVAPGQGRHQRQLDKISSCWIRCGELV